jgi:hypothetical protein
MTVEQILQKEIERGIFSKRRETNGFLTNIRKSANGKGVGKKFQVNIKTSLHT